jgi:hypothetical protein
MKFQKLPQATNDSMSLLSKDDWKGFYKHAEKVKNKHWEEDTVSPGKNPSHATPIP